MKWAILDRRVFNFGMDCLDAAWSCKFKRDLYWHELKDIGSFDFMRGIESVVKNVHWGDGLIPYKIRKVANVKH